MQEPINENKTLEQGQQPFKRPMETAQLEPTWIITDKMPVPSSQGTLALWNWLIREERAIFLVHVPGAASYEVVEFKSMSDKYFILVVYKDKVVSQVLEREVTHEFVVPYYTTFGIYANWERWFI